MCINYFHHSNAMCFNSCLTILKNKTGFANTGSMCQYDKFIVDFVLFTRIQTDHFKFNQGPADKNLSISSGQPNLISPRQTSSAVRRVTPTQQFASAVHV